MTGSFATRDKPPPSEDDYTAMACWFLFLFVPVLTVAVLGVKAMT